jgi:predicted O-methyltransferase YrrM
LIDPADFDALLTELETTADDYWNVGRDNAAFLAFLLKSIGARRVLEVGTSNGYSALWFARALSETSGVAGSDAKVITIEFDSGRAAIARENIRRAGLENIITLLEGDARELIPQQAGSGPFDFVFLDADKPQYADYLRAALPLTRVGGILVGDDTLSLRDQMPAYIALAHGHPDLETVELSIDDGIVLSRRLR